MASLIAPRDGPPAAIKPAARQVTAKGVLAVLFQKRFDNLLDVFVRERLIRVSASRVRHRVR